MTLKHYRVSLTPDAVSDLTGIYEFIADSSGFPEVAWRYISKLKERCEGLHHVPIRGRDRNDIRPNLRILSLDKNAIAAFEVDEDQQEALILNIFYGGEDYETIMQSELPSR